MNLSWGSFSIGALFGILITQLLNHFLAKDRAKQDRAINRYNQAVSDFKNAFIDVLINLSIQENSVAFILKGFFTNHKVAYLSFREHLPEQKKNLFDNAWSKYEQYYNAHVKDVVFGLYASAQTEYESMHRKLVMGLIRDLLSFAKEA